MLLTNKKKSVLWAIDLAATDILPPREGVRELAEFVRRDGLELIPVTVVTQTEQQWENGDLFRIPELQAAMDRYLRQVGLRDVGCRVLLDEQGSHASAVRALLALAGVESAAWITVSSHGRKGVERLLLGSFAERLVGLSPLPVLFLPHEWAAHEVGDRRVALFPTDLSPEAHVAFSRFLPTAARHRLEVVIFHAVPYPVPSLDFGLGPVGLGPMLPEYYVEDQTEIARIAGKQLEEEARAHGVRARMALGPGMVTSISGRAVLAVAQQEGARLIALAASGGAFTRFLMGGVAQEIFRAGYLPTLLYGPSALEPKAHRAA